MDILGGGGEDLRRSLSATATARIVDAGLQPGGDFHRQLSQFIEVGIARMQSENADDAESLELAHQNIAEYANDLIRAARRQGQFEISDELLITLSARCRYWPFCFGATR